MEWSNGKDLMVIEKDGSRGIVINCYSKAAKEGIPKELPPKKIQPNFRQVAQVEK